MSIYLSAGHSSTDPGALTATERARFFSHVEPVPEAGCWLWAASWHPGGYGQMNLRGRPELCHRLSWEMHKGPIPSGLLVCHRCDTPACVNPDHLFLGTNTDNMADMLAKGRHRSRTERGEKSARAKITDATAAAIFRANGSRQSIADRFGVNRMTVSHIKLGKQWNTVTGLPKPEAA